MESVTYIGVDPGLNGAVASLSSGTPVVADMPTRLRHQKTGKSRREVHTERLRDVIATMVSRARGKVLAVVEAVGARKHDSPFNSFAFGQSLGEVRGILVTLGVTVERVSPAEWKRSLGVSSDKWTSIRMAQKLWPGIDVRLKEHHGRAEAALIAEWARRTRLDLSQGVRVP